MIAAVVRSPSSVASPSRRRRFRPALSRPRVVAALVAAGLACGAGLATAGTLPGVVEDLASAALAKVGISVPGGDDEASTGPGELQASAGPPSRAPKSGEIPALARKRKPAGVGKGAGVSAAANGGKGHAGQRRSAPDAPAGARSNAGKSDETVGTATRTTRAGVEQGAASSAAASKGKSRAGEQGLASSSRRPATRPSGGQETRDNARRRTRSTGPETARQSGSARGAPGSGNASNGQQGGAGSGGQGTGGSGNPGNGGQGGDPANGSAGPGGSGGDAGRNGRP